MTNLPPQSQISLSYFALYTPSNDMNRLLVIQWLALLHLMSQVLIRWIATTSLTSTNFGDQPNGRTAVAFDGWTSIGHALQGLPVAVFFAHYFWPREGNRCATYFLHTLWCIPVGYPFYNLVKRASKMPYDFAQSSYASNTFEWTVGVFVGLMVGWAWKKYWGLHFHREETSHKCLWWLHALLAILYTTITLTTYTYMTKTWEKNDKGGLAALIVVPWVVVLLGSMVFLWNDILYVMKNSRQVAVNFTNSSPTNEPQDKNGATPVNVVIVME